MIRSPSTAVSSSLPVQQRHTCCSPIISHSALCSARLNSSRVPALPHHTHFLAGCMGTYRGLGAPVVPSVVGGDQHYRRRVCVGNSSTAQGPTSSPPATWGQAQPEVERSTSLSHRPADGHDPLLNGHPMASDGPAIASTSVEACSRALKSSQAEDPYSSSSPSPSSSTSPVPSSTWVVPRTEALFPSSPWQPPGLSAPYPSSPLPPPSTLATTYNPAAHKAKSQQRKQETNGLQKLLKRVDTVRPLLETTALLALWYASNIFYNIYNKQALQVYPHAMTCTLVHLVVAILLLAAPMVMKLKPVPKITNRTFQAVIPLSILHLAGFLTTNMSLGAVNVSLTHTIKSLEPFFTVMLTVFLYGTTPALSVMLTLVPIVAGVIVASATDLSFNWYGFLTAMGSNLAFQARNVISKRYMTESSLACLEGGMDPEEVLNETDLFLGISLAALPLAIPIMLAWDGPALVQRVAAAPAGIAAAAEAIMPADVVCKTALAGVCRTADVFASYGLLSRLNPVTHSVANCVKRVVVIAVSIIFFNTKSSYLNIIGTVMALSGVFAYSMAERMPANRKKTSTGPGVTPLATKIVVWMRELYLKATPGIIAGLMQRNAEEKTKAEEKAREEERAKAKAEGKSNIEPDYFL